MLKLVGKAYVSTKRYGDRYILVTEDGHSFYTDYDKIAKRIIENQEYGWLYIDRKGNFYLYADKLADRYVRQ